LLDLINADTEMLGKTGQDWHTRFRNLAQRVHHGDAAVIDGLHDAARSLRQLRRITARSSDRLTDVLQRRDSAVALNARIGERGHVTRDVAERRLDRYLFDDVLHLLRLARVPIKDTQDSLPLL